MTYVTRIAWLLAWAVWLWLGVGLHRELPRDLGTSLRRLPFRPTKSVVRLIADGPLVVAIDRLRSAPVDPDVVGYVIRRWDMRTGEPEGSDEEILDATGPFEFSPRNEFVAAAPARFDKVQRIDIATTPEKIGPNRLRPRPNFLLDLLTGRWLVLWGDGRGPIYHPQKPWAIFWSGGGLEYGANIAIVVDLRTGRELFQWREGQGRGAGLELATQPFFIGDRLGVPTRKSTERRGPYSTADGMIEVWSLPPGDRPLKIIHGSSVGADHYPDGHQQWFSGSEDRVAWHQSEKLAYRVKVFDAEAGGEVFSEPKEGLVDRRRGHRGDWSGPALSSDGRTVLNLLNGRLFDIDTRRLLWSAADHEYIFDAAADSNRFEMHEEWTFGIGRWTKVIPTFAVRRLSDGALEYRTWLGTLPMRTSAADGNALTMIDDEVFELPPCVSYSLLAFCQTILALPIILAWAVLRYRRRRAARRQPAVAPDATVEP